MKTVSKQDSVTALKKDFAESAAVVFADYKGVTSEQMNALRKSMRDKKVVVRVAKNNLVRIALKGTAKEKGVENLAGPMVTMFAKGDAVEMAKAIADYAKKVEAFTLKEGFLGDSRLSEAQIKQLATLPSREQLLSQLLSVLNGPARNLVCVLNAVQRDFTRVVQAIADKKGQQQ
jgi:large subunit ribosomal protein L10